MSQNQVNVLAVLDALELQTRQRGGSPSCETIAAAREAVAEMMRKTPVGEIVKAENNHSHTVLFWYNGLVPSMRGWPVGTKLYAVLP